MLPHFSIVGRSLGAHRWIATICGFLITIAGASVAQAQQFPYGAKVAVKSATVRSGPGANYYHTDRLPQGSRVEVYRHDGAWAAVRPPEGSYSWVLASAIELTADASLGHVVTEGVRTRIGSRFSDDHNAHYVSLQLDEMVQVMGRRELIDGDVSALWYQIKPPAGEFRWLRLSSLEPLPDPLATLKESALADASGIQSAQFLDAASDPLSADAENVPTSDEADGADPNWSNLDVNGEAAAAGGETWTLDTPGAEPQPLAVANDSHPEPAAPAFRPRNGAGVSKTDEGLRMPRQASVSDENLAEIAEFRPRQMTIDPALLRQELAKINAELSRQIVQEPTLWQLDDFRARAQAVIDLSSTNNLREQAQSLLSRITQFQDIQRRHHNILQGATENLFEDSGRLTDLTNAGATYADLGVATTVPPSMFAARQSQTPGSAYDGMGWLMPVVTQHPGLPRYALTDDNGNILQFVSPLPGLNLHNYERRRIAVIGRRGFVPRFNKAHLTAERIISLDRVRY